MPSWPFWGSDECANPRPYGQLLTRVGGMEKTEISIESTRDSPLSWGGQQPEGSGLEGKVARGLAQT